jgi:hypothetical protein
MDLDMVPSERELICHKSPPDVIRRLQRAYFQDSSFFPAVNSRSAISQKQPQKFAKNLDGADDSCDERGFNMTALPQLDSRSQ